jgi:hypothetical protein
MRINEPVVRLVGDREVSEVERIPQQPQRHDRETVKVRPSLEKDEFEAKLASADGFGMTGVVPPFRLRVGMSGKVAGQFDGSYSDPSRSGSAFPVNVSASESINPDAAISAPRRNET